MAKKSYLELAYEDDIKKNTGKDRDKVTYKDLAALDDKENYGKVYNDAMQKLSNPAIWREPKEFSDLRKRADAAAYGQSGDLGKFFSDVRDMSDERAKYYAQFGSKDKFVGAQIDNMDKRQVREPSSPVAKADILPKNTNDYLRFQSDQMMGAGPQAIGTNPIAEMMEKQKFFQQTAHDPQALQFAKFRGEYDQMGRDNRLDFEKSAINVEREDISRRQKALETEYYTELAKLEAGSENNMRIDQYKAQNDKVRELKNRLDSEFPSRLSMLDSMQGQVESTQRWNKIKDKYAPYLYKEDFEQNSKYNLNIPEGKADEFLKRPDNFGASYEYAYVNEPGMFKDSPLMNDSREFMDYLSDDERKVYNYIYNTKGNEAANQMLDDMREQLSARRSYEQEKGAAAYAKEYPVLSFLNARGQNFMKSSIAPLQLVAALTGAGKDDPIFDVNRITGAIDSTNAQEMSKAFGGAKIPFIDADAGEVVYGILSSGADALAAMGVSKLLLGKSAASGRMIQGIMSTGAASSAMKSAVDRGLEPWKVAVMGLMGGAIEAVTEKYSIDALFNATDRRAWAFFLKNVFTEGSEELASSALNRITDGIMNADKSEIAQRAIEIARTSGIPQPEALKQARMEWLQQAGVEFISGAVMGGVFAGPGALSFARSNAKANKPATVTDQIANKEAEIAKKESEAYENAARERMDFETRDGEAAKKYSELVKLVNESFPEESETKAKIAEATTIDTKRMTEIATGAMQELRARMQAEPTPETLKLSEALTQTVEGIFAGMQTDRNAITDKYTAGLDEAVKSEIKGKNDVSYAKGYGIAHALGQMGVSNDTIAKATGFEDAKKAAEEGRAKWDIELPKAKNKAAELRKTLPVPGKGGVTYHSNVKQDALTTGQRDQIALLEQVAKPMGYKFVMVEFDKDAAGNYVTDKGKIAPNGYFRDTDGTIYIDVNAGKTAGRMVEDTIIPQTAGHELTHYLKANAPDLFRAYGAAVIEELSAKGQDINALIAQKIGRAKQADIGVDAAVEEVIADASSMMLQNTQAVQMMAETNPGLFQKITEWVKDFIERVRKAFSKVEGTPEAKAIMNMRDGVMKYTDSLQKMWDDMAVSVAQAKLDEKPAVVARRDVQAAAKEAAGKKTAYTSDGQAVDYHYEIVPVGSLIPSNLETSLEPNPDYPQELQPRDRTRAASQQQVEEIANKLNPALLGESADVGTGAPFIGPDMVVESGNGRVLAITRAMRQGKGLTYTQWLKDNAGRFGLDPAKIDNASVLVRVRDTEVNRPEFVQKANESQVATYSDSESAVSDAKKVTPAMLEMANMDSGDINSAGNSSFVASFISKVVPVAERGRMMDASGKLSKSGENRVRTALFQMAYEDGYLTEQMAEASDDTSKNILKAMTAVAPRLALMNDAMKKGALSDYPIGQAIAEAYRIVQRQKRLGVSVDRYINQQNLVRQDTPAHWMLLEMFNENRNAPNRMTDALNAILNAAERQGNPNQMLMPGLEAERPSVEGIVRDGLNRYADEAAVASERDALKFQMRTPVEETAKLIAVHNLSEAQLLSSVELGGFAMPSIAVIRAGQPHDRYGDISIVFGKETIDPENYGNKVYGGDAWTPTFPQIDYEISEAAAAGIRKKVSSLLGPVYKDMRPALDDDNMQDVINRAGGDPVKAYEDNNALKAAYLRDIGENFTPRYSEPDYGSEFGNDAVKYIAERMGGKVKEALGGPGPKFMSIEPDIRKALNGMTNGKFGGDVYAQPFGFGQIDRLARAVSQYMNSNGVMRLDTTETARDIREAMKEGNHETGYKAWLKGLFNGIIEKSGIRNNAEIFTPSGNRRSFDALHWSVTLENIVRSMKSQDKKGVGSMGGVGLFGVSTKNYNSLSDIRKDIGRLKQMDREQYQAKRGEFMDRISELANEIAPKGERNRFIALDRASEVLTEAARKGTTAGIQRVLNGYKGYYNIREDTAKKLYKLMSDISRMPTEYFEAKPERAVGFDEVRAVIIPDTASDALKKALDNVSAPVIEYKADDNADRLKALNSPELDGVKFQERDAQYLSAVESGDMDTAQKMVDEAAKVAGYTIKAYHGTSHEFYEFDKGKQGNNYNGWGVWGKAFYFSGESRAAWNHAYKNAGFKDAPKVVNSYLKITNPYYKNGLETIDAAELENQGYDGIVSYYFNQAGDFAVFSPDQVKLADPVTYDDSGNVIPLSQRFTDSNDIRFQERDPAPAMYSKMAQEIEAYKGDKMGADSVVKYLQGRGVKADEIRWSGIVPFLQGKKSVSKAELLEFAQASALEIKDVTHKGADYSRADWNEWAENEAVQFEADQDEKTIKVYSNDNTTTDIAYDDNSEVYIDDVTGREFENWDDAFEYARDRQESERNYWLSDDAYNDSISSGSDGPKYDEYSLEDGRRYREILFTAPKLSGNFQSSHWTGNKNVLAHTRLQDFQTPDGKPVLFVEEVQSDWHEKGREEGYNQNLTDSEEAEFKVLLDKRLSQGMSALTDAEQTRYHKLNAKDSNKIPEAPFAATWHEYVLKRVLRMAAEGGYDYVGWTTGQMQADRYNLSKQVGNITIAKMGIGKYLVNIYDKSKSNIFGEENVTPARLSEVVGKEVARHVIEQAEKNNGRMTNVSGDGLTMGGGGMKSFYDIGGKSSQNIPRFLNKYGAQWGAKIQTIDMQGSENTYQVPAIEVTDAMKESVLYEGQPLYQERDPDYRTKRDILAGAFDSVAQTEVEKRNLKEYKNLIGSLNRMEEEARGLRLANSAEWKKPEPDRAKVNENKKRIFEIEKRIFSMDKKLIQMQNAAPLRNVLIRQKKAYERKAVEKYKGKRDTNELNDALDLRADRAAKRLMKYALTPDKNSHVPDGMRTDITNLLTALDLASEDKAGNARDSYRARSWQEALTALGIRMKNADMVAATTKGNDESGPALLVDPALQDKIESLIKRNDGVVRYRNLKTKEKQTVVEILESVSVAVSEANKKFSADRTKTISDVADKTIDYAKAQREKKLRGEIAERLSTFLNIDMADAFTFFDSLGEGGQEILKGLYNDGFSKLVRNTEEARAFFDGLNAKYSKYGMSTWGGKNATPKNFKVASGTLTMTPAQVMELYMLNKREQARGHIYGQGIRVERIRSRKPGKAAVLWQKDALTVTPAEIEAITSTLTEQQKQVAEEFGAFFGRTSTKWGNEVSMTLYGYYKFIEQNYYPIHSDTNFTMTQDPNSADMLYALLNIGATKDTVKFANNPIIISDIFDTVTRHITDMANYNAFAPALVDAMKWFNYKRIVKDEAGNMRLESVKGGIERMMGAAGKNYVINLLKAVNGIKNPQVASGFSGMVNSAIGKFKTSAVGANARVVLQQHASYVRGSALLSPASMTAAYFRSPRRGMQMARKYSAIAAWKHMGYFDMNIGRQMSDLINGNESTAEKIRQAAMKPAGLADDFTIGVLWNAAEIELGKTYKGDKRSEEFYKLVGEKLTEVIDRTQVVDTVFHRSQIMRDKDGLTKIATNFMSEPIKTYNLLMGAVKTGDLKTIARTGTVALLSYVVVAMAAGLSDAARDKDKEKGWQGYWESWMKNVVGIGGSFFESNVWDNMNPLNMIPFGKDVYGLATGYSPSRPDLQAAQRMIWAANDWMKLFKGENKDLYKLIYNTANAISTASGVPISNVMRDVKALYDTLDPRVVVGDNTKVVYQRFADALANGEEEKALAYYNALIDSGRDSVTIRTQAMQRYKDEETVIAAAEAKKAGDYAAYEKAIDQAVKDGIPRDMAIKAADGLSTGKAEKTKPERAKTIDEVKKAMDYKDTYTYESNDLMTVIEKGDNVTAKKIIDKMLKEGRKKDAISGSISSHFKPIYLEAYKKGQASNLKAKLLTMYALLGYDRNDKSKDIDAWLKQK